MNWQGTELAKPARIPALDGIRGLAIFLVLVWHIPVKALRGHMPNHPLLSWFLDLGRFTWSGVELFFVLSGFLIGGILLDAAQSPTYFSTFYIRRAYRILPLYFAVVMLTLAIYGTNQWGWAKVIAELSWYLVFLQNFQTAVTGVYAFHGLSMTWSLAVEEQFYLTLPLVIRFVRRRALHWLLVAVVVGAPLLRIFVIYVLKLPWIASYILTPCRADTLSLGVLIAIAMRSPSPWEKLAANRKYLYAAFALVGSLGIWMLLSDFQPFTMKLFGLEYSLLAVLYALLLLCTLISPALTSVFSFRPLRFIGSIAYGLYLFHGMVTFVLFSILQRFGLAGSQVAGFSAWLATAPLSIGLAALSWKYFEKPLVERGHRYRYGDRKTSLQNVGSVEKSAMQNAS